MCVQVCTGTVYVSTPVNRCLFPSSPSNRKQSEVKLLHACEGTVVEWAELVSEFLQQDWSKPVLDGLKPLPSEEFSFWRSRQQNLHFLQKQLMSPRVQQVESIFKAADSIYWSTLRDIYRDVQEGVQEAEDIVGNLGPVQQKLEEVEHMEYQQLGDNMAAVMEEVRLLWTRSEFYCKPCRVVVLLQEICNLFTHLSRKFLHGQEVMRSLASDPAPVLADVRLVIWTLKTLKETYAQNRTLLETQNQNQVPDGSQQCTPTPIWDFPSHLVFLHLDSFLNQLHSIQEVFSVSLKVFRLDQTVLSGVSGVMWTDTVQQVYQKFLVQVRLLSDCSCDPTDPEDQNFRQNLDRFQDQVSDLETQLVSVLSRALEDCSEASSAAKVVKMFGFLLDRLVIQAELRPQLTRLVRMVRLELDRTELLFHTHRGRLEKLCRFHPPAAAQLSWIRQLRRRAEEALKNYGTVQNLCLDPAEAQLVLNRFGQILELLLDFKDSVRSDWSSQLDSDCGLVLDHPLIRTSQSGLLEVGCSHKVEEVLRGLRYVTREGGVALQPNAARLSARRDDITQSYLMLSHMASCYNQVVMGAEQVELDLIQDQLQDLNQNLSHLQRNTWNSEGEASHDHLNRDGGRGIS
ncbi:dynein axonemal heavy chain 17-like [Odontesthes bonariensis]